MHKYKLYIVLMICTVLLSACSSPVFSFRAPSEASEKKLDLTDKSHLPKGFFPVDLNVVAIGDSLTEGVGDSSKKGGYVPYVVKFLSQQRAVDNVRVSNLGKRGNRTDQLLERLDQEEIGAKVSRGDVIFVTIGGNDIMKVVKNFFYNISVEAFDKEQAKYEFRLNRVLNKIRTLNPNAHIYLIGFYNPFFHSLNSVQEINTVVSQWNQASERIANRHKGVTYVKVEDIFSNPKEDKLLGKDQFHPNKKGYQLMADRINFYVKQDPPDNLPTHEENDEATAK
ncbi:SGNH/GDSL hydrolase family protein [Priestia koreensis]|uniref:SGNH/GDSL hydrolase family protein n=1 Tax=Priestia koreensis TaxID=284581 RepID=UPI001F589E30|nr:SGNH/GDSL hydrolase family protein [Priestia koreensis]MCM3003414.1 SGNH/GDSL hydrolase family protein [Priestia koreensis]UNL86207.1 SGNH/GDSL hydrolase family protein [Priestia koreensis]